MLVRDLVRDAASAVPRAATPEALSAIHRPGCPATIWDRQPLADFQDWLDGLPPEQLPSARVILRPDAVRKAAREILQAAGMPACDHRDWLGDDIAALADIFAGQMGARWLRLRLDRITTNACRRFHVDAITARLVCTYRGTGTKYGISGPDGADPAQVFTVATGSPIVMRGTLWPERPATGLRHRSPPIEGTGETRLVLVLEPVDNPEDDY